MIEVVLKRKETDTVEDVHLPSWMYSKWVLAAMSVILIAWLIYTTPVLNTAVLGSISPENAVVGAGNQPQQAGSGGSDGIQTGQVPATTKVQEKLETRREEVIEEIKDLIIKDATLREDSRTILGRIEDKNSVILSLPAKNSVFSTEDQSFYFSKIERKGDTIQGKIENRGSKKRWVSIESYVIAELEGKHGAASREVKMGLKEWDTDYYIYSNWEMEPANEYGANEYGFVIKRIPAQYRVSYVILTIGGYKERK